jgi:sigma-B regulation protein RsbU (phosphoserine phosphatase)
MASETDNQSLDRELLRERFAMRSLLEFARTLTPDLGPEGILKSVLRTIMGKGLITEGFAYLALKKDVGEQRYHLASRSGFRRLELPVTITFEMLETWLFAPPERTHFTLPIFDSEQQEIIGFLGFGKSLSPETDIATEQNYLESLSLLTGIALTNAALFESERERERYEAELRLAREIQQSLLPQSLPEVKGLSFTAYSKQSELVGGDYYDVIKLSDGKALVAIADVVGKGISAAILMSNLQASLRALVSPLRSNQITLLEMVKDLNRLIYESTAAERYITAVFAIIDSANNSMNIITCGHPRPILYSAGGEYRELPTNGVPLGVIQNYEFKLSESQFLTGESLLLYTDGLSEAMSAGQMLGAKGVENFVKILGIEGSMIQSIETALSKTSGITITDDVTVMIVKRVTYAEG